MPEPVPALPSPRSRRIRRALSSCPLYFILDQSLCEKRDPRRLAQSAIEGGVRLMQLRFKDISTPELLKLATAVAGICHERGCLLMINDRADIAMLSGADGVHLGEHDLPVAEARRLGPRLIVGGTARRPAAARALALAGADCIGCGSVFPSTTKSGLPLIGLRGLRDVCRSVTIPVTAIGGIGIENCGPVMGTGAAGFTSISAFRAAGSTAAVVSRFMAALQEAG